MRTFAIRWIVLFRFRAVARIQAIALILVNTASLPFLHTVFGQVCLAANIPDRGAQPALFRWIATVVVFNSI